MDMYIRGTEAERFWPRVAKADGDACWPWKGRTNEDGYGRFTSKLNGRWHPEGAHRTSWRLHYGPIPEGAQVLHSCDNPPCVRPDHLFLGDPGINSIDKIIKGRGGFKLTFELAELVRERFAAGETTPALAKDLGVTPSNICAIIRHLHWPSSNFRDHRRIECEFCHKEHHWRQKRARFCSRRCEWRARELRLTEAQKSARRAYVRGWLRRRKAARAAQ